VSYYLAPSLVTLRAEINAMFPRRDTTSDGWIGDTSHAARPSDHNPDWSAGGVVRAIDIDVDDRDPSQDLRTQLIKAACGDERTYYVISDGRIYSYTYGFTARHYTGSNAHFSHVHVSIREGDQYEDDTSPWFKEEDDMPLTDDDIEKLAKRVNQCLGDYTADGKKREGTKDPEQADARLRQIENKIDKLLDKLT
jgi:hypothetical protein